MFTQYVHFNSLPCIKSILMINYFIRFPYENHTKGLFFFKKKYYHLDINNRFEYSLFIINYVNRVICKMQYFPYEQ